MAAEKITQDSDSSKEKQEKTDFSVVKTLSLINNLSEKVTRIKDRLIIKIIAETGCTSKELVNIKYSDILFHERAIIIAARNKKTSQRKVLISENTLRLITEFADPQELYLFPARKGRQVTTRSIRKIFSKYSEIFGEGTTSRSLRQALIIDSLKKGISCNSIKENIGIKRLDEKKFLTSDEFKKIRKHAKILRDKIILDIIFETGCKLNELARIRAGDIGFTNNSITITPAIGPAGRERKINISDELRLQLEEYTSEKRLAKNDFLISSRQSGAISDKRIFQIVKGIATHAGIIIANPKILRNSCIVNSIEAGRSIKEISSQTGISSISRLNIYGSLIANRSKEKNND